MYPWSTFREIISRTSRTMGCKFNNHQVFISSSPTNPTDMDTKMGSSRTALVASCKAKPEARWNLGFTNLNRAIGAKKVDLPSDNLR